MCHRETLKFWKTGLGAWMSRMKTSNSNMKPMAPLDCVMVVLSRASHPGNIGSAARALKTMGFSRLALVAPGRFPAPEAVALASGAADVLEAAMVFADLDAALAEANFCVAISARARDLGPSGGTVRDLMPEIALRARRGERIAFLFGNETAGLSNEELQRCQRVAMIPANPGYSSLNLAAAVQVVLYEARLALLAVEECMVESPPRVTPFSSPLASHAEREAFFAHLEAVMRSSGFLRPACPGRLMPKLRRLFSRTDIERDEINILRGFLSAVSSRHDPRGEMNQDNQKKAQPSD
jgi:tRNA/rRNA methyltransferase